ncbi:DNA topoisomerase III [Mytilus galloprovincialis]|uniref:DNA topoisomerase n=2 Tax=Mytilus galloprovincialis TaxID=29158 RepID=A0A8B6CMI4_MYTGA|nr:DNA topoisomerase III [Mytilus galloprovincialis]
MYALKIIKRHFCSEVNGKSMVRILNVAEKNDAAKSIANVLSRGSSRKREGFSKFNKIYEFEYNILNMNNCTMSMTSLSGHLLEMDFIGQYRKWYSCSPVTLFDVPVEKHCHPNMVDIKRTLEREIRGCQHLIIWTDCDREGENIGFEAIQVCKAVKPNIPVYRAKFSEITPQAIARACSNLIRPDKNVSDAVDVRQELDLRIGASFTRFQTLRLQKIFPDVLADQLISYGSCQFPTMGFVVERYKQVQAFIPEPFWKLKVSHSHEDGDCEFTWKRNRLFDHLACLVLYTHCIENPVAKVVDVKSKTKSKWRPTALDTVEMEKLASRKLRINAKETMKIAEKLYTQGFISYPRTETNMFPKELDLQKLVEDQTRDNNWGDFARRILENGPNPRNGNKTDQAHPPIHPTKYTDNLQGNEKKVYEFVVRHFLACVSQDAQGFETTVEIDIADEKFTAQGLMITAKNYLEVYVYDKWNAKVIPVYNKGDAFQPNSIEMVASETSPPSLLTEADLIALMDKHGIGTDATHADHIETIKSRMYVGVKPDGKFVPGQLGMGLVEGYDSMGYQMSKPNLRAELEADLKRICEGKKNNTDVLQQQVAKYKEVFVEACKQAIKLDTALSTYLGEAKDLPVEDVLNIMASLPVKKCPNCGQDMTLKTKKDGKGHYIGCMGYPGCKSAIWLPDFVLEATVEDTVCQRCLPNEVKNIKFKFKRGSVPPMVPTEYTGCIGGCDEMLNEALNLSANRPVRPSNVSTQRPSNNTSLNTSIPDSGYGSSGPSRSFSTQSSSLQTQNSYQRNTNQRQPFQQNNSPFQRAQNQNKNDSFSVPNRFSSPSINNPRGSENQNRGDNPRVPLLPVQPFNRSAASGQSDGSNSVVCNCGEDGVLLTVRKEGPNTGRQFYKCGGSKCQFFLWADEAGESRNDTPSSSSGYGGRGGNSYRGNDSGFSSTQRSYPPSTNDSGDPCCKCGNPGKSLTVQKEGPNKGKQFFGCSKPRGEGCNFFQWADENSGTSGNWGSGGGGGNDGWGAGSNRGGGVKKRGASSTSNEPGAKRARKCGLCGVEGHTKKTCPHK